ncbi:helix-turn-helix domain-containing protein [Mucilaginibacter phyllosphaerae]
MIEMLDEKKTSSRLKLPIGRKIEKVRRLRGFTQEEVGKALGISKQAYSKVEQSDNIPETRLEKIAEVLGVTTEGLKSFQDDLILNNASHFNEAVNNSTINHGFENTTHNTYQMDPKVFQTLTDIINVQREMIELFKKKMDL